MSEPLYAVPSFLEGIGQERYNRWLHRKAANLCRRDKQRGYKNISTAKYKKEIHVAVDRSKGRDEYTGEELNWNAISTYKDKKIHDLPSVDHCHELDEGRFKICSWKINDMKNDMSEKEFVEACKKVLKHLDKKA
ncbi:MAG: hypothetical protein AAB668_02695 [Patescibacteria group bacterium]